MEAGIQLTQEEYLSIIENYRKKVNRPLCNCMHPGCKCKPIFSHVFQKKGILSSIATNSKVYMLDYRDLFSFNRGDAPVRYKLESINNCFGFYGFCKEHDNSLFLEIERKQSIDWTDDRVQYLLAYRTICREVYVNLQVKTILRSIIDAIYFEDKNNVLRICTELSNRSVTLDVMLQYKTMLEESLLNEDYSKYEFRCLCHPFKLGLCLASPICISEESAPLYFGPPKDDIDDTVNIVNIFPYRGRTMIIMGFLNGKPNYWAENIYDKMRSADICEIASGLQDVLFRSEFHCLSTELYEAISSKVPLFIDEWLMNSSNYSLNIQYHSNLFEDYIKQQLGYNY